MRYLIPALALLFVLGCQDKSPLTAYRASVPVRYYVIVFAYETEPNLARNSHTFATFIRVTGEVLEEHTISWYPQSNNVQFSGNQAGKNMNLQESCDRGRSNKAKIYNFGAYEIEEELYIKALAQISLLESGAVKYHGLGNGVYVCNCIHACSNVVGPLKTGASWGRAASRMVLDKYRPWIIDPNTLHPEISERVINRL